MSHRSKHIVFPLFAFVLLMAASLACAPTGLIPSSGGQPEQPSATRPPAGQVTPNIPAPGGTLLPLSPEIKACLDSVKVYPNAKEDPNAAVIGRGLGAGKMGMRAYATQDSTERVVEFYKANLPNPNCQVISSGNTGLALTCKMDDLNLQVVVARSPKSPGTDILIQCYSSK